MSGLSQVEILSSLLPRRLLSGHRRALGLRCVLLQGTATGFADFKFS